MRGGILGLGLLMGGAVFSYGRSCRCHKAEILAIRDDGALTACLGTVFYSLACSYRGDFLRHDDVLSCTLQLPCLFLHFAALYCRL